LYHFDNFWCVIALRELSSGWANLEKADICPEGSFEYNDNEEERSETMFMIMLILNDADKCQDLMNAWDKAGVPGVTVMASSGLGRIKAKLALNEDLPLLPSLEDFFRLEDCTHRTLISIVRDRAIVDAVTKTTHAILGDLNRPMTGILVILPVIEAYGLDRYTE
jgi:nitrogen regulatory protein PII